MLFPGLHRILWTSLDLHRRVGHDGDGPAPVEEIARALGLRWRRAAFDVEDLGALAIARVAGDGELDVVIEASLSPEWHRFALARSCAGAALHFGALTGAPVLEVSDPWECLAAASIGAGWLLAPPHSIAWAIGKTAPAAGGEVPESARERAVAGALEIPEELARAQIRVALEGVSRLTVDELRKMIPATCII